MYIVLVLLRGAIFFSGGKCQETGYFLSFFVNFLFFACYYLLLYANETKINEGAASESQAVGQ